MKKITAGIIFLIVLLCVTMPIARAVDVTGEQADTLGVADLESAVPGDADELIGGLGVMESLDVDKGVSRLLSGITSRLGGIMRDGLRNAAVLVIVALLCSLATSVFGNGEYINLAAVLAVSAVCVTSLGSFIDIGRQALDDLSAFSKMLLPALSTAALSSGALTSAAAKYAATTLFLDVLMSVSKNIVMPLIYAYTAVSVGDAALGGDALKSAAGLIKWLAKTVLTLSVLAFIAYLSITGIITGASDAVAIRATKFTISTVLPVVGSIIADASDTVLAGASILRNAVGVFGLIAVVATCAVPFLRLGVNYLLFKAASGVSGSVAGGKLAKLIDAVGTALGLTLAMAGSAAVMLFVSIISVIRTVG